MIYILGGASRSGKTMLSRRAVSEKGIPYFPLDALFNSLVNGAPELGVTYGQSFVERAEKIWPVAKALFKFFSDEEQDFLIEGDSILPNQVNELIRDGIKIKAGKLSQFIEGSNVVPDTQLDLCAILNT